MPSQLLYHCHARISSPCYGWVVHLTECVIKQNHRNFLYVVATVNDSNKFDWVFFKVALTLLQLINKINTPNFSMLRLMSSVVCVGWRAFHYRTSSMAFINSSRIHHFHLGVLLIKSFQIMAIYIYISGLVSVKAYQVDLFLLLFLKL